jgi:hypothetical protein
MSSIVRSRATHSAIRVPDTPDSPEWAEVAGFIVSDLWQQSYRTVIVFCRATFQEEHRKEYGVRLSDGTEAWPGDFIVGQGGNYEVLTPAEFNRRFEVIGTQEDVFLPMEEV